MTKPVHPFTKLRQTIRQSGRQFRHNNDTSKSIFHPSGGFVYGYDMNVVEQALNEYEETLASEYHDEHSTLTIEEKLVKQAHILCNTNPNISVRDFARSVAAYLVMNHDPAKKINPLRIIKTDYLTQIDGDTLDH